MNIHAKRFAAARANLSIKRCACSARWEARGFPPARAGSCIESILIVSAPQGLSHSFIMNDGASRRALDVDSARPTRAGPEENAHPLDPAGPPSYVSENRYYQRPPPLPPRPPP